MDATGRNAVFEGYRKMTTKNEPTPTPWEYVPSTEHHGPYITSQYGNTIADFYVMSQPSMFSTANGGPSKPLHHLHEMADPNAEFCVHAVNCHAELLSIAQRWAALDAGAWFADRHATQKAELLADTNAAIEVATGVRP